MIGEPEARELGRAEFDSEDGEAVVLGDVRELECGWLFPVIAKRHDFYPSVIVNKETGRALRVMTESSLDHDPTLYDRGYQFQAYDVVVLSIDDLDETVGVLLDLHSITTDVYYRYDRVYRVGRALTDAEIRERLTSLPAVFSGAASYRLERFEEAREAGWFDFKMFEYRGKS